MSPVALYAVLWRVPTQAVFTPYIGPPISYTTVVNSLIMDEPSVFVWSGLVDQMTPVVVDVPFSLRSSEELVLTVMSRAVIVPFLIVLRSKVFA
jgi:hypothetical protein